MFDDNQDFLNNNQDTEIEPAQSEDVEVIQPEDVEVIQPEAVEVIKPEEAETAKETGTEQQGVYSQGIWSQAETEPCAKLKPRKKKSWIKRAAVLVLCGVLLGSSGAAAYLGVLYYGKKALGIESNTDAEEVLPPKEPEINKVEVPEAISDGTMNGAVVSYDVSDVVENVMPAMVSIINNYTETYSTFFGQSYTQQGASSGSGIIIGENDSEILIATNYHVVSGSDSIEITFIDGSKANAYIKGTNPQMDLAVVSVILGELSTETKASIAVASLGNSDELKLGQSVIAIGNALGYGQSVTTGVVSAVDRQVTMDDGTTGSFIQTDAAINPGNSGGALLNSKGQVIGINSSKIGGTYVEGIGYAIPISAAEPIISDLSLQETKIKVDEADRGYLGVTIDEVTAEVSQRFNMPMGVFITAVQNGSGAQLGGMKAGDIIVGFDSFKISSYEELQEAMQYYAVGDTVSVEVKRAQNGTYESVILEITLGQLSK